MTIDLGTGDGRAVLRAARAEAGRLAIGVDAYAASMRDAARRAERRSAVPNALFVVSSVEELPSDLDAVAAGVTVAFPWGSLLRGLAEPNGQVLSSIARISAPGADICVVWSVIERDGHDNIQDPEAVADAFERSGFAAQHAGEATQDEIAKMNSSWAKRLRAGRDRPAHILRTRRRT